MDAFKKIKKNNGEAFAKTIRDYHNGIFEVPNIVEIVKHAGTSKDDAEGIMNYLSSLLYLATEEKTEPRDPFQLLKEAGYEAFHADSLQLQNSISPYFTSNESLCTFNSSSRFKNYYIVNCVHESALKLKREDFTGKEKREDSYGVSVISIQISKSGGFISIKNRYNHTVPNCDNTFKSDPENIITGLSTSLQNYFGVDFKSTTGLREGFTLVQDQVVKVAFEENGVFFGDRVFIKEGKLTEVNAVNHEYLFDSVIFNTKTKMFSPVDSTVPNSFVTAFNDTYGGKSSVYVKKHCVYDGDIMLIGV